MTPNGVGFSFLFTKHGMGNSGSYPRQPSILERCLLLNLPVHSTIPALYLMCTRALTLWPCVLNITIKRQTPESFHVLAAAGHGFSGTLDCETG